MIEREPITVVLSEKGWIRSLKGHNNDEQALTFKADDRLKTILKVQTTDKLLLMTTDGKVYTLGADRLPGGRGHGEPVRIMLDITEGHDVVSLFAHVPGARRLVASDIGNGFVVEENGLIANTRKGKQVLNVSVPNEAKICVEAAGDHIAVIGENRKMLLFPLELLPEMTRGRGVMLQRYKDGGVSDVKVFAGSDGLSWNDSSGRNYTRTMEELAEWVGERAQAGRMPPNGFPRSNKFSNQS